MTDQYKDDAMLKQYLEGKSELSDKYQEQQQHQPSAELDNIILGVAQDAASGQTKKSKRSKNSWIIPTSIAATLVLSFSLIQLQKPAVLYQVEEKEMDIASMNAKPAPQKKLLEKKKERRKIDSFAKAMPLEESLADREALAASAPAFEAPATTISGLVAAPQVTKRQQTEKQTISKDDTVTKLSQSQWLEKIKSLLKDNKPDEAKKEFELFIKAYPDFVPDTALKQQLGLKN